MDLGCQPEKMKEQLAPFFYLPVPPYRRTLSLSVLLLLYHSSATYILDSMH
jgi:hypothetical protein